MQQLLPFQNFRVPSKHIVWLSLANAGDYYDRKFWFYPFKTRFLRRRGVTDGLDIQTITLKCWCGDGIFRGIDDQLPKDFWRACNRCSGTGIYSVKRVVLIRWLINGVIFHEPSSLITDNGSHDYKIRFDGLIKHSPVAGQVGRRAMLKLMLRYEPQMFLRYWQTQWRNWRDGKAWKIRQNIRRVKMLLTRAEHDDVPF